MNAALLASFPSTWPSASTTCQVRAISFFEGNSVLIKHTSPLSVYQVIRVPDRSPRVKYPARLPANHGAEESRGLECGLPGRLSGRLKGCPAKGEAVLQ